MAKEGFVEKFLSDLPAEQQPTASPTPKKAPVVLSETDSEEIKEAIEMMAKKNEELGKGLEKILDKGGVTPRQLQDFLANPANMPATDEGGILYLKEELEKKLQDLLSEQTMKAIESKKRKKSAKKSRTHALGSRKGWIPMK